VQSGEPLSFFFDRGRRRSRAQSPRTPIPHQRRTARRSATSRRFLGCSYVSAVDDHHAVGRVELVLGRCAKRRGRARSERLAVLIHCPSSTMVVARSEGTARPAARDNLVVDEGTPRRARRSPVDDRARAVLVRLEHENKRRRTRPEWREADAMRLVHQNDQPVGRAPKIIGEVLEGCAIQAKRDESRTGEYAARASRREPRPRPASRASSSGS